MTIRDEEEAVESSGRYGAQRIAPAVAPVMYFRHPVAGFSGPPVPFLALTPPPTSAVVLSLLNAFTVGAVAPASSAAEEARKRNEDPSKRQRSDEDQCGRYRAIGDSSDAVDTNAALKRKKYTYVARREERDQLEREIIELEERARQLREACAGAPASVHVVGLENARMREAVSEQQHVLASVQSVMTEFANGQTVPPLSTYIHLTRDLDQRREALLSLRSFKLEEARRFLAARTQHMTPGRESWEENRFWTREGDVCGVRLDVTTYRKTSAKAVFDGIMFFILNAEISLTEMNGALTVRENDDHVFSDHTGVLHHRLVTSSINGLQVEKNAIMFYERSDGANSKSRGEFALITSDFVDRDDMHPYQPKERIRKDLTVVMEVSTYQPPRSSGSEDNTSGDDENLVVLTRWMFEKLHSSQLAHRQVSKREMEALQRELMCSMDGILGSVQQSVDAAL